MPPPSPRASVSARFVGRRGFNRGFRAGGAKTRAAWVRRTMAVHRRFWAAHGLKGGTRSPGTSAVLPGASALSPCCLGGADGCHTVLLDDLGLDRAAFPAQEGLFRRFSITVIGVEAAL
jgi:hypothetical protein